VNYCSIDAVNKQRSTALAEAAAAGRDGVVKYLAERIQVSFQTIYIRSDTSNLTDYPMVILDYLSLQSTKSSSAASSVFHQPMLLAARKRHWAVVEVILSCITSALAPPPTSAAAVVTAINVTPASGTVPAIEIDSAPTVGISVVTPLPAVITAPDTNTALGGSTVSGVTATGPVNASPPAADSEAKASLPVSVSSNHIRAMTASTVAELPRDTVPDLPPHMRSVSVTATGANILRNASGNWSFLRSASNLSDISTTAGLFAPAVPALSKLHRVLGTLGDQIGVLAAAAGQWDLFRRLVNEFNCYADAEELVEIPLSSSGKTASTSSTVKGSSPGVGIQSSAAHTTSAAATSTSATTSVVSFRCNPLLAAGRQMRWDLVDWLLKTAPASNLALTGTKFALAKSLYLWVLIRLP